MAHDKELEIRLQFLDEAQEYVTTLETCLLGLANALDADTVNEALRAAHSIKGGAGLMGFQVLSDLAHRLEDGLKVLKVKRSQINLDASLEQQLLQAVDCLTQVITSNRHQSPPDADWLNQEVEPLFQAIHERLGDPEDEDAYSVLSPEDGQEILPLLFQTEVEGCLQRLETVLADRDPCLKEEVMILSQELEGLGEMLQMPTFTSLCQSICQQMEAVAGDAAIPIAEAALGVWRETQNLVLAGNLGSIPDQLNLDVAEPDLEVDDSPTAPLFSSLANLEPEVDDETALEALAAAEADELFDLDALAEATATGVDFDAATTDTAIEAINWGDQPDPEPEPEPESELEPESKPVTSGSDFTPQLAWDANSSPSRSRATSSQANKETASDNTVRVPVKQINDLSDLFGELTIERNRLDLEVKRLRDLVFTFKDRLRSLDQTNVDLRTGYDRVATQSTPSWATPLLPPAAGAESAQPLAANGETTNGLGTDISDQFDVLELDRYRDMHLPFREIIETIVQLQEVGADIDLALDNTEQTSRDLRKTARQLQKHLTQVRMRPLSDVFDRFPRALRQMSLQYDKPVDLVLHGGRTLVDRNVLEALQEPLTHIIRNCFDHGIETPEVRRARGKSERGTIELSARQQSNRTIITIRDDGGGIPIDKIRDRARQMGLDDALLTAASDQELLSLIFEPGFSTASQVSDLSGRGIGMDAVRNKLREIRGDIQVDTVAGVGTTFTLTIPYTLSVTRVLIVESRGLRLAFPVDAIAEMLMLEQCMTTAGKTVFEWHGELLQLIQLSDWLVFNCPTSLESPEIAPAISAPAVLLVQGGDRRVGIKIDRSWGEQEVALRRVEGNLPMPPGFNSCTILGDGQVVPLVNISELLYWIASCEASGEPPSYAQPEPVATFAYLPEALASASVSSLPQKPTILVVDDSINVRRLLALALEKAGYQVAQAKDGRDALDKLQAGLEANAILCDVEMPRLDGYGFLAQLKSQADLSDLPVAMLTSRSSTKHRQMAMRLGASAYFTKPYNEQMLLQTLEELTTAAIAR